MAEVVRSVKQVTDIIGEIAAASSEQNIGIGQVGQSMSQMDHVTQQERRTRRTGCGGDKLTGSPDAKAHGSGVGVSREVTLTPGAGPAPPASDPGLRRNANQRTLSRQPPCNDAVAGVGRTTSRHQDIDSLRRIRDSESAQVKSAARSRYTRCPHRAAADNLARPAHGRLRPPSSGSPPCRYKDPPGSPAVSVPPALPAASTASGIAAPDDRQSSPTACPRAAIVPPHVRRDRHLDVPAPARQLSRCRSRRPSAPAPRRVGWCRRPESRC